MIARAAPHALAVCLVGLTSACASTYHPEYHPESSYSSMQNVTYAQNAWVLPPRGPRAPAYARGSGDGDAGAVDAIGQVTTPGGVIIYGDLYGNVYVGR